MEFFIHPLRFLTHVCFVVWGNYNVRWSEDFIPGEYAESGQGDGGYDDEDEDEELGVEEDSESMLSELSSLHQDDCLPTLSTNGDEKLKRLAMQFIQAREQEVVEDKTKTKNAEKPSVVLPKFAPRSIPMSNVFLFALNSVW